jgi:hypothetical protein
MRKNIKTRVRKAVNETIDFHKSNLEEGRKKNGEIYLGRMFSLGVWFQYFLAKQLIFKTGYKALVDCPIVFKGRKQPLYPDILIIKEKGQSRELKYIVDVKLDLGYIKPEEFGVKILNNKGDYKYEDKKNRFKGMYRDFLKAAHFKYHEKDEYNTIRKSETEGKSDNHKKCIIGSKVKKIAVVLMENVNHHNRQKGYKKALERSGFTYVGILKGKDSDIRVPCESIKKIVEIDIEKNAEIKELALA